MSHYRLVFLMQERFKIFASNVMAVFNKLFFRE